MIKINCLVLLLFIMGISNLRSQDYSNDNKLFETISWQEFFNRLDANPNLIFFDIRTPGERFDTSRYKSYNQGKIKGAIETDFFNFDGFYPEYVKYKKDTIYLYCSHSRRSRLLSKRLSDSSFAHIVNINGGISLLNTFERQIEKRDRFYTTNLKYKTVSPFYFIDNLRNNDIQFIDVRPDSQYYAISNDERDNSYGKIENVIHIPYDKIMDNLGLIEKSKTILMFDNDGELAPIAAEFLVEKEYRVSVLLFGLANLQSVIPSTKRSFFNTKYNVILPEELFVIADYPETVIIDVRTESEFKSIDSTEWKNVGRLKNAINIPLSTINKSQIEKIKDKKIVLYDIMMHEELYSFAKQLKEFGIEDFYLLSGGIFQLKWEIANMGKVDLQKIIN